MRVLSTALFSTVVSTLFASSSAYATSISITTWNVEHLMSTERFKEWKAFCEKHNWNDPVKGSVRRPDKLTYCDAHSGSWRGRKQSKPIRSLSVHQEKQSLISETLSQLNSDVYLFQEVSDVEAVKEILPSNDYYVYSSYEPLSQKGKESALNLAFAVKKTVFKSKPSINLYEPLMVEHRGRKIRPGLVLTATVGKDQKEKLDILNVHLKASCSHQSLSDSKVDCLTLSKQVVALEDWVEQKTKEGSHYMVAGDLNRKLYGDWEYPARTNGSDASSPISNLDKPQIGSMLREINDGKPENSDVVMVNRNIRFVWKGWNCHYEIDHFLLGEKLMKKQLTPELPTSDVFPTVQFSAIQRQLPNWSVDNVRLSDHCPLTYELQL